jgi:hypothetical protein
LLKKGEIRVAVKISRRQTRELSYEEFLEYMRE